MRASTGGGAEEERRESQANNPSLPPSARRQTQMDALPTEPPRHPALIKNSLNSEKLHYKSTDLLS